MKAELKDGVLEVRVAKPETTKPQRIRIGVEGSGNEPIDGTATSA